MRKTTPVVRKRRSWASPMKIFTISDRKRFSSGSAPGGRWV